MSRNSIIAQIDLLLAEQVLKPEAAESLRTVFTKNEELDTELTSLRAELRALKDEYNTLQSRWEMDLEALKQYRAREEELLRREHSADLLQLKVEMHAMRVDDHKEMMHVVFRNQELKREVMKSGSTPLSENGFITQHPFNETQTTKETTE